MRETLHTFGWMISSTAMNISWNCSGEIMYWQRRFLTSSVSSYDRTTFELLTWNSTVTIFSLFFASPLPGRFSSVDQLCMINLAYINTGSRNYDFIIMMFSRFFLCFDIEISTLSFAGLPRLFSVRWCFFYKRYISSWHHETFHSYFDGRALLKLSAFITKLLYSWK